MWSFVARACVACALVVAVAAPANAAEGAPWYRRPYAAVRVVGAGSPDLFGASGTLYLPRPLALEVGVSRGLGDSGSVYARTGPALSLRERPSADDLADAQRFPDERFPTFDVLVQPMAGFRWSESNAGGERATLGGPTFSVAGDLMIWCNAKVAIDLQLSVGGAYWLMRSDPTALAFSPDVHLAAGFAF